LFGEHQQHDVRDVKQVQDKINEKTEKLEEMFVEIENCQERLMDDSVFQ
jgi:ribosomal 50S subunit-associated protein YjgA (DUF615 family)